MSRTLRPAAVRDKLKYTDIMSSSACEEESFIMIPKVAAKQIVVTIDQLLKPPGFSRRNKTWNRSSKLLIKVIDLQTSKSRDSFTINCWVFSKCVYQLVWNKEVPGVIKEYDCSVRSRANALLPGGRDRWFDYGNEQDASDAERLIKDVAIPFIEGIENLQQMAELQKKLVGTTPSGGYALPVIELAALEYCGGDRKAALDRLDALLQIKPGVWKDLAEQVRERMIRMQRDS